MAKSKLLKGATKKPRPLGFVKEDRIHFQHVETDSHCPTNLETALIQDTCHFLSCLKSDDFQLFNQMFTMRETLRQVAVANVVASVSRELTDTMQLLNTVPTTGSTCVRSESMASNSEVSGVYLTKDRSRKNGDSSNSFRENTIVSLVPPAPPNTASAPAFSKSLMSDRSQQVPTSRHAVQGELENCLHSISINNKESVTNVGPNVRTRNKIDEFKSASSESSTETVDRGPKVGHGPLILTSDVRVRPKNSSLSSYALCGTGLSQPSTKDSSRNIDMLSVRSSLDSKTRYGSVNSDDASKISSEEATTGTNRFAQSSLQISNNSEKNIKWDKSQLEISKCSAVDIDDSLASYVLYGLSPTVSQSNTNSFGHSSPAKHKVTVNETFNRLPSIRRAELSPSNHISRTEPDDTATEDTQHTSFDFSEGLKIVSLNHSKGFSSVETGPRGQLQFSKPNNIQPANTASNDSDKENLNPDGVVGTNMLQPKATQYFDGLHLIQAPSQFTKNIIAGRKRLRGLARSKSLASRDKFRSPSPIDYDDQKRDIVEDLSLVGQSLPSINLKTWSVPTDFNEPEKQSLGKRQCVDESSQTNWYEFESLSSKTNTSIKYKSSLPNTNGDAGTRFSDDNLRLKYSLFPPKVTHEPDKLDINNLFTSVSCTTDKLKSYTLGKWKPSKERVTGYKSDSLKTGCISGKTNSSNDITSNVDFNKVLSKNNVVTKKISSPIKKLTMSSDSTNHNTDSSKMFKPDGKWQSPWSKSSSETISPILPPESESVTMRSLLDQVMVTTTESDSHTYQDPVGKAMIEPLYMGCSSQVPDGEAKSMFHYIHGDNTELGANTKVKVLTALDHDVYSDFQHKKYRDNVTDGNLNTALDKPRMHFIKIRVKDDITL